MATAIIKFKVRKHLSIFFTRVIITSKICKSVFLLSTECDLVDESFLQCDEFFFFLPLSTRDGQWFHMIRPFSAWVTSAAVSFGTLPSGAPTVLSVCA